MDLVETQKNRNMKCLQTANGEDYISKDYSNYLIKCGITRRLTIPYTPEHNGVADRKKRTLLDNARCLPMYSGLPSCFCTEAVNTADYIIKRSPNGYTTLDVWTG